MITITVHTLNEQRVRRLKTRIKPTISTAVIFNKNPAAGNALQKSQHGSKKSPPDAGLIMDLSPRGTHSKVSCLQSIPSRRKYKPDLHGRITSQMIRRFT